MPRAPVTAFLGIVFGAAFLVPGLMLLTWIGLAHIEVARGFDGAVWAAQHVPREWGLDPVAFGNWAINHKLPIGIGGAFLTFIGLLSLKDVPCNLRPIDVSDDGRGRIVFKLGPPRVGRRLEGSIFLLGSAQVGDRYELEPCCTYIPPDSDSSSFVAAHFQLETRAEAGVQGPYVPFSFDVPITAPPSDGAGALGLWTRHDWQMVLRRQGKRSESSFDFEMEAPSAEEIGIGGKGTAAASLADQLRDPFMRLPQGAPAFPWMARAGVVKSAEQIRVQRTVWRVISWGLLAFVAVYFALTFVANELAGNR